VLLPRNPFLGALQLTLQSLQHFSLLPQRFFMLHFELNHFFIYVKLYLTHNFFVDKFRIVAISFKLLQRIKFLLREISTQSEK